MASIPSFKEDEDELKNKVDSLKFKKTLKILQLSCEFLKVFIYKNFKNKKMSKRIIRVISFMRRDVESLKIKKKNLLGLRL